MLDQLPIELVEHIVRLAAFPSSLNLSPSTYRERQDTLLSLCRTNKKLCAIAQPVLFGLVELDTEEALDSFLEAVKSTALGRPVKRLRVIEGERDPSHYVGITRQQIRWLGEHLPNVVEYFYEASGVGGLGMVNLSNMQSFPNLQSLVLHRVVLCTFEPFTLPSLRELSLVGCWPTRSPPPLTSISAPALQAVHWSESSYHRLPGVVHPEHIQRLAVLSREYNIDWPLDDRNADRVAKALLKLDDLFTDNKLPYLRTLYLPILLDAPVTPMRLRLQYAVRDLDESCKSRKVDVVFEQPGHLERDLLVPHAFWRRKEREIEAEKQRGGSA
ncbi:hypothetical protein JCM8547_007076 [Rhodosporidiobolus lusitaniae]